LKNIIIPDFVQKILSSLVESGYEAYIVGGSVRDILLSRTPHDWDIATSALPENIMGIFKKTLDTGIKHGTVTVFCDGEKAEVTTFRTESGYSDRRRPDSVIFVSELCQDLLRRDFTINAMAMTAKGQIIDYFGGTEDLQNGIIRCVGDANARFEEDALRMLRALRFKAALGFEIEPLTLKALEACSPLAASLSPERVREELVKILLSPHPEILALVTEYGLFGGYVLKNTVSLSELSSLPSEENIRLAAFCLRLKSNGNIASVRSFLEALRFSGRLVSLVSSATSLIEASFPVDAPGIKRILREYGLKACRISAAASGDKEFSSRLEHVILSGECYELKQLAVNGNDLIALGLQGENIGRALTFLLDHVVQNPNDNNRNILLNLTKFTIKCILT
jgi:tRNA nucleotidyltransferase/poly(A) polymerase